MRRPRARLVVLICSFVLMRTVSQAADVPSNRTSRKTQTSTHPLLPSFERFYVDRDSNAVRGGQLLLGELNCVACHKMDASLNGYVIRKQAPVLDEVASRVRPKFLRQFIANPHRIKPGTTMPALFGGMSADEKKDRVEALVHFLAAGGTRKDEPVDRKAVSRGEVLFDRIGCVACHAPRRSDLENPPYSVPLPELKLKYTIASLTAFLRNPHRVRPSGRMPSLNLQEKEAKDLATYLLKDLVVPSSKPKPTGSNKTRNSDDDEFVLDPHLVKAGRRLFTKVGCASCHQMREKGQPIRSTLSARPLARLKPGSGCLANAPPLGLPHFGLSARQRDVLRTAVRAPAGNPIGEKETIARTMTAFNCYACHQRDKIGGVEQTRNALFQGAIPEMGDEGRIPPHLDGVGDKLQAQWLKQLLSSGANDRPYMHTRMPNFGAGNVGHLTRAFVSLDENTSVEIPEIDLPPHRIKSTGRFIIGDKALSCIKCHNFGPHKATGIQSIDLQTMTRHLRQDWFHRYMINPQLYRRGTRMPSAWPNGRSVIPHVLAGDTHQQLRAIWDYLADGHKAAIPLGLSRQAIELIPGKQPIIYRNFINSLSPRGIAVGYPEQAHLAFDADQMCLALIWHGSFIDASRHWLGRGEGFQQPLGDHVLSLVHGVPFAVLESAASPWPERSAKQSGYRFLGYRLDKRRRPIFRYGTERFHVEDFPKAVSDKPDASFQRTITLTAAKPFDGLWFRAAAGSRIEGQADGWFLLDAALKIRVRSESADAVVRKIGDRSELLLPVRFNDGTATIVQEFVW